LLPRRAFGRKKEKIIASIVVVLVVVPRCASTKTKKPNTKLTTSTASCSSGVLNPNPADSAAP